MSIEYHVGRGFSVPSPLRGPRETFSWAAPAAFLAFGPIVMCWTQTVLDGIWGGEEESLRPLTRHF